MTVSSAAALLPWRPLPGWEVTGAATAPGAPLWITLAAHVPADARLTLDVVHTPAAGSPTAMRADERAVRGGQTLELTTPYPYDDLVAGAFAVRLDLRDSAGRHLATWDAGSYTIRRFRFSA